MQGRAVLAGALALAGGVLAIAGSFLPWAEVTAGPFTEQAKGIDGWEGKAAIVAGAVMVTAGIRVLAGSHQAMARLRPGAAIGGLVAAGVGVYTAVTIRDQLVDVAATELPRVEVERALDNGLLQLTIAIGLYLVIAGGIQGIAAALVALGARDEPVAPSGAGLRGWSRTDTPGRPADSRDAGRPRAATRPGLQGRGRAARMSSQEHRLDTGDRRLVDVTDLVEAFCASEGRDGLVNVFVPHATAGVALMETGSGSEADLEDLLERLLPRDDRYRHRHGSLGHGGDHLLPVLVAPSLSIPVDAGRLALGTWQRVVVVDPNRENDQRRLRLTFVPA